MALVWGEPRLQASARPPFPNGGKAVREMVRSRIAAVVIGVVFTMASAGGAYANAPEQEGLAAAIDERSALGLPSDPETVASLVGSSADVGSATWGIPMTAQEMAELDPEGRMQFANELGETLIPFLETLSGYAGAYIDQLNNGGLVVLLTQEDPAAEARIESLMPANNRGLVIKYVALSHAQLLSAAKETWQQWPQVAGVTTLRAVTVDPKASAVRVAVDATDFGLARELIPSLSQRLGVPLLLDIAEPSRDECHSPDSCYSPMRAGIRIRQGSTSGSICTMAFHITKNGDEQFLTAGHCGYSGSNNWYHQAYGLVGSEQATLYFANGIDAMRVQIADSQASNLLYLSVRVVTSARDPILNELVCAHLGNTNTIDCGTVGSANTSWISSTCGCVVWGADHNNISTMGGDSGSPLVAGSGSGAIAVGIHNNSAGNFAKVGSALNSLGWAIYA